MSLFSNILNAIFHHSPDAAPSSTPASAPGTTSAAASPAATTAVNEPVDIAPILNGLAAKNPESLDWKKSIVDLMKLVGIDSSLSARKELAAELGYTGDTSDSAAMNTWLHKAVLRKISENGGKIPADLLD